MPPDLPKLSAEQKARLDTFTAGGGVIIRAGKAKPGIAARAENAARGPRLSLEPRGYVLGQLTRKPDGRTLIPHLLNYDHEVPAENVRVRMELNGLVEELSRWELEVLSPDTPQPQFNGLSLHGCVAQVHPGPDQALYRGDFLAQSGAVVLSNSLGILFAPTPPIS
jgi:hypothetical protein